MIFVVDDSDTNLITADKSLEKRYRVMTMSSAAKMFKLLNKITPDLILLDIEMPEMNGFETLARLKAHHTYASIPVIFLTSQVNAEIEANGFDLGVVDFITKPFSELVLLNRIRTHLEIDAVIRERTSQLERLQNGILFVLADLIENRDHTTGGHNERTTIYIKILLDAMMERKIYANEMSEWNIEMVALSARLHDVGKITIPDYILNKPGPLSAEECETMKTHVTEGERIIDQIISRTGDVTFLQNAKLFAGYHHEHWAGPGGYPYGKKGTEIPLQGRIMAIVDVYDALVSERPYKKPFSDSEAVDIIMKQAGLQFDPVITEVFFTIKDQFKAIRMEV